MTVAEMIKKLNECPPESEVMVEIEGECDVCSHLKHEKCTYDHLIQFADNPYYHAAADETRIKLY